MRELPLNNKKWVEDHIVWYYPNYNNAVKTINLYLNDLILIKDVSKLQDYQYINRKRILIEKTKGSLLVFKDTNTSELFKIDSENKDLAILLVESLCNNGIVDYKYIGAINHRITIDIARLFGTSNDSPKGRFVNKFLRDNYDMSLLNSSSTSLFKEYVSQKLSSYNISTVEKSLDDKIMNEIKNNNLTIYDYEFSSFVFSLYDKSNAREFLGENIDVMNIKFNLLKTNYFTGKYKVYMDKYTDNTSDKRKVFDTINIELNMASDHDADMLYLKANIKDVKMILKDIIESNKISKDYANYLKLFSLILTRDNILVARFCLKDGLQNLKFQ